MRIGREINIDQGKVMDQYFLQAWDGEKTRNKGRKKRHFFFSIVLSGVHLLAFLKKKSKALFQLLLYQLCYQVIKE